MNLHQMLRQLRIQFLMNLRPESEHFYSSILMLTFALIFLVVGLVRMVEFNGIGFSTPKRAVFYVIHSIGCFLFAIGFALFAIDPQMNQKILTAIFLGAGFFTLVPLQIYLALIRRIRNKP